MILAEDFKLRRREDAQQRLVACCPECDWQWPLEKWWDPKCDHCYDEVIRTAELHITDAHR